MPKYKVNTTIKHGADGKGQPVAHVVGSIIELSREEARPLLVCGAICEASATDAAAALPMHDPQFATAVAQLAQNWGKPVQDAPGAAINADELAQFREWQRKNELISANPPAPIDTGKVDDGETEETQSSAADAVNKAATSKAAKAK